MCFFFQAEDGIRDDLVTGVQTCALPISVAKSPGNARAHFQLAQAYYDRGDYAKALPQYEKVAELEQPDDRLYVDWGLAYDQLNQPEQALAKLKQAAAMNPTAHVYSQIGMVYGKQGRNAEALEALARAEKFNPNFEITYVYRGGVHQNMGDLQAAIRDYRQALAINPHNQRAAQALVNAEASLRSRP